MQRTILSLAVLLVFSGGALAHHNPNHGCPPGQGPNCEGGGEGGSGGTSIDLNQRINNSVQLRNSNKQGQVQGQGQKQGQGQSQSANNEGNTQALTYNETKQHKNTPSMGVASIYPTANCRTGLSASVAIAGFGIGGGGAPLDENCARLEAARFAAQVLGNQEDAKALFCLSDFGKEAPSCKATADKAAASQPQATVSAEASPFPN